VHQLAIHGSGANVEKLTTVAKSLGLKITAIRNNPFDMVPNVFGRNDLSPGSLGRSLKFQKFITGNDIGASPHTLPYLGIETYQSQLQELGHHKAAKVVKKYIAKHCI